MGLIPPIGTKGRYSLKAPFTLVPNQIYSCGAIRYFKDVENHGENVFDTYYKPLNIASSIYNTDRQNNEAIITLLSDAHPPVYVPSSFILSYPDQSNRPYQLVVMSAMMGPLPVALDLTFAMQQMSSQLAGIVGVPVTVNLAVAPSIDVITPEQAELLEANRQAAITNSVTDYAKLRQAQARITQLEDEKAVLVKILKDNDLLP